MSQKPPSALRLFVKDVFTGLMTNENRLPSKANFHDRCGRCRHAAGHHNTSGCIVYDASKRCSCRARFRVVS